MHPSNRVTKDNIDQVFRMDPPTGEQRTAFMRIRGSAIEMVEEILFVCPDCADRSAAIRQVRQALLIAGEAIALAPREED